MSPREYSSRVSDIRDRIFRIRQCEQLLLRAEQENHTQEFETAYDAILYNLLVIGEAVKSIYLQLSADYHEINWREIARLRDVLVHQYHQVNAEQVFQILDEPLRQLAQALRVDTASKAEHFCYPGNTECDC
ncbi:MAG: DUF86 domain-containing protein [Actinobacteria bacterium]|nr:DUF86 domain-containing protein [Actinomycetota bacterium]